MWRWGWLVRPRGGGGSAIARRPCGNGDVAAKKTSISIISANTIQKSVNTTKNSTQVCASDVRLSCNNRKIIIIVTISRAILICECYAGVVN